MLSRLGENVKPEDAQKHMAAYRAARETPKPSTKRRADSAGNKTFHSKRKKLSDEELIFEHEKSPDFFEAGHIYNWLSEIRKSPCCSNCLDGRCYILPTTA